jgi:hypothetical protein
MPKLNKRARHLQDINEAKRQRLNHPVSADVLHETHWEGLSDSEEESDIEISEPEDNISELEWSHAADAVKFSYQRGSTLCERQQRRIQAAECELAHAAKIYSQSLNQFFLPASTTDKVPPPPVLNQQQEAIKDLEKKLHSKKTVLNGQNLTRHQAVLALLYMTQSRQHGDTREELSYYVA